MALVNDNFVLMGDNEKLGCMYSKENLIKIVEHLNRFKDIPLETFKHYKGSLYKLLDSSVKNIETGASNENKCKCVKTINSTGVYAKHTETSRVHKIHVRKSCKGVDFIVVDGPKDVELCLYASEEGYLYLRPKEMFYGHTNKGVKRFTKVGKETNNNQILSVKDKLEVVKSGLDA